MYYVHCITNYDLIFALGICKFETQLNGMNHTFESWRRPSTAVKSLSDAYFNVFLHSVDILRTQIF